MINEVKAAAVAFRVYVMVCMFLLIMAGPGCSTDRVKQMIDTGVDINQTIEARKAAEKAEKEAARIAAEKAEAARIAADAAEKAERERPEREAAAIYTPPTIDNFRKAALWKCEREGGGPGVFLLHSALYGHIVDAYIAQQPVTRPAAVAGGLMIQPKLNIQQPDIFPVASRGNGGKVHIRALKSGLSGPGYLVVLDKNGKHWWISIPDLGKRWGATHPSDKSPYGGPISSVGIIQ